MGTASTSGSGLRQGRPRLELPSLERDCMRALWPLGEATVREIRKALAERRPRAYTTVMTIMDRLAQKGIVNRRKVGRAYVYSPNVSAEQARAFAVGQLVENFFGGTPDALEAFLRTGVQQAPPIVEPAERRMVTSPRARPRRADEPATAAESVRPPAARMDDTLL